MSDIEKVDHRAAWTARALMQDAAAWTCCLSAEDVAELDAALGQVKTRGLVVPHFGKDAFPIPGLMRRLAAFEDELNSGLGVLYVKGFPIERYTKDEASAIFWGLGVQLGIPWEQNLRGHLLGDVINEGRSVDDPSARGYQSTAGLEMHTDGADLVGLLCLRQAPEGGENQIVSAMSVFNRLVDTHPDVARHLLDTEFCIDWRNEEPPGEAPYHRGRIYTRLDHGVSCFALVGYIHSAQRHTEVPRLTAQDRAALERFQATQWDPELVVRFRQQPGDMVFLNNHFHLHARSTFRDSDDPRQKRHLRRLWLESPAWAGRRPGVMQNVLRNARGYWARPDSTVQMWDQTLQ